MREQVQDLYKRFDGADGGANTRLAWYGQCRAAEMTHAEAIADTYKRFRGWCDEWWPKRGLALPSGD